MMRYKWYVPYLFIFLALIGLFVFRLGPIVLALIMGFTDWSPFGSPEWVGIENYIDLFTSPTFWTIFKNTIIFSAVFVPTIVVFSLLLAVLLNKGLKGTTIFRVMFFAPVITSTVAIGIVWQWIFSTDIGFINFTLRTLGIDDPPSWLSDGRYSLFVVAFVYAWKRVGYYMIIYLAGLQDIPRNLIEAARVDGATKFTEFKYITLPLITPTMFFVLIMSTIDSFKSFEIVYTMTKGGPGVASTTLSYYVYQNAFELFQMGTASSIAMVLLAIVATITYINFKYKSKWVQYRY
ncbi:carbohydrate ABC transporter permease [Marinitoga lauensis]|uniref:carbohydrate ABC transporter permease n=1 Tax=Marinitoga lauensis TaxID=2201189 RepID=UPI0019822879|nr:sugar ABC transporter permease [Marinitoga lauensis]